MITLVAVASLAIAAVPGSPTASTPMPERQHWIEYSNDNLLATGYDDGFTASFAGGIGLGGEAGWRIGAHFGVITDKTRGTRSDEVTLMLGRAVDPGIGTLVIAVGARAAGDLGGEQVQAAWHKLFAYEIKDLRYERDRIRPVVLIEQTFRWSGLDRMGREDLGFEPTIGVASTGTFHQGEVLARVWFGNVPDVVLWVAPVLRIEHGRHLSQAAEQASKQVDPGITAGVLAGPFTIRMEWARDCAYGSFGVAF